MGKLTETEKYLLEYIDNNIDRLSNISITKLSELASVSTATIFRAVNKLGYTGFSDFKLKMISNNKDDAYIKLLNDGNEIKKIIQKNQLEVRNTIEKIEIEYIDDSLNYLHAANCVYIFARGLSEQIGNEMEMKFHLLNKRTELYTDPNIIRTVSKRANNKDCVVYISLNGETQELIESANTINNNDVPSILLTTNSDSTLSGLCMINIVGFKSQTSYFPDYEVRSRLSLHVLSRILLDSYANRYGIE